MGICWYCHWGWPRAVAEIYRKYAALVGERLMEYGPAHVVWCDENFEDCHVRGCVADCDADRYWPEGDVTPGDKAMLRRSLEELLAVPEAVRCCVPDAYDDEHPEDFPPPPSLEMVRKGDGILA